MSLFSEIGEAVDEVLSDPDLNTADVKIRRVTGYAAGPDEWTPGVETQQLIKLSVVAFTRDAEYQGGGLVVERGDELTISPWATVIEENGAPANRRIRLDVLASDEFIVDGDVRRTVQVVRVPAAGPDVSVWVVRVVD